MALIEDILNFRRCSPLLFAAGQPTEDQLHAVAAEGVRTVVNLALPTSSGALPDERASVLALGMEYVPIPVHFEAPKAQDFADFVAAMDARRAQKVLVHCALNYRASAFVAMYRVQRLGWSPDQAYAALREVWEPDAPWSRFLAEHGIPSLATAARAKVPPREGPGVGL